jgi:hypothetical protein
MRGWTLGLFALVFLNTVPVCQGAVAFDTASDHAYDNGLTTGTNGGSGFSAWTVANSGASAFIGSSSGNGGSAVIDSGGRSFGVNAAFKGPSSTTFLRRDFSQGTLITGQTFSFDLKMGAGSNTVPFVSLVDHSLPANSFILGPSIALRFNGDYGVVDNGSDLGTAERDSGIPVGEAIHAVYTFKADQTYSLTLSSFDSSRSYSTSGPTSGFSALNALWVEVDGGSSTADPASAMYFNNLGINVPEPSSVLLSLGLSGLCVRRWRNNH